MATKRIKGTKRADITGQKHVITKSYMSTISNMMDNSLPIYIFSRPNSSADALHFIGQNTTELANTLVDISKNKPYSFSPKLKQSLELVKQGEAIMAKNFMQTFGKAFRGLPGKDNAHKFINFFNQLYSQQISGILEFSPGESIPMKDLQNILEYRIGEYFALNQQESNSPLVQKYKKIAKSTKKKAQYDAYLTTIMKAVKDFKKGQTTSPAILGLVNIFEKDSTVLSNTTSLKDFNPRGLGGIFAEAIASIALDKTFQTLVDSVPDKELQKYFKPELVGSTIAKKGTLTTILSNMMLGNLREGTNLAGDNILGTTDLLIPTGKTTAFRIDMKNPQTSSSTYITEINNLQNFTLGNMKESSGYKNLSNLGGGIRKQLNLVFNQALIAMSIAAAQNEGKIDPNLIRDILRVFVYIIVADDSTLSKFYTEIDNQKSRPNLVLIGEQFFLFSTLLEEFQNTYFRKPDSMNRTIAYASHALKIKSSTLPIQEAPGLWQRKKQVVAPYSKESIYKRLNVITKDPEIGNIFRYYRDALNSTSFSFLLTLNLNRLKNKK